MDKDFKVIIIGAGLAGLAIAHGLKKSGVSYTVVDKDPSPRERAWGVTISWSHPDLQTLLSPALFARLKEVQPDPTLDSKEAGCEGVMLRDGATGEMMVNPYFPGIRRVNLQKWRKVMGEGINVKFGKTLTRVDTETDGKTISAHFSDGSSETGNVLIGCDGGGSAVRAILLGSPASDPEVLSYEFLNFPVKYTAEQALYMDKEMHPIVDVGVHPKSMYIGLFLLDKPDLKRPETWVYYILATWPKEEGVTYSRDVDMLPELRKRMDGWADPYKSAVAWASDEPVRIVSGGLRVWAPRTVWDNRGGRLTIGGDAAHSMTFHRGQGGNNALRDAERFVSAMLEVKRGKKSLKQAIDDYDNDVRTRGVQEVDVSTVQTHATHDHASYKESPVAKHGIRPTIDIDKHKTQEAQSTS